MLVIFSSQNIKRGHKLELTYLYACWIKHMRHHLQISNGTPKVARNAFNIGVVWNPVCCRGNQTVHLALWSTSSRILLQRIEHFWFKLAEISFSSYLIKIWLCMTSLVQFAYFKNLNISGTKRYLNVVNSIFRLTQATCLCFKMAAIGKMRFSSEYHFKCISPCTTCGQSVIM